MICSLSYIKVHQGSLLKKISSIENITFLLLRPCLVFRCGFECPPSQAGLKLHNAYVNEIEQ